VTPQPTQSISIDEIFANFRSVLNLQLIPEDERNTDAAAARREAATAAAAAATRLAQADFVDFVRPMTPTPQELISLLHRYPEAAAAACAERMRRPHNLQSSIVVGRQAHPYIGQFNSPQRPGDPRCERWAHGQHVRLETTSPLPYPEPPTSPWSTPPPPITPPPPAVPPPALAPLTGHKHQIRMLPAELPPRPTAAVSGRAGAIQQQQERHLTRSSEPVSASTTRYPYGMGYLQEAELFFDPFDAAARARSCLPPASPLPLYRTFGFIFIFIFKVTFRWKLLVTPLYSRQ
jgi:hypothetical protein